MGVFDISPKGKKKRERKRERRKGVNLDMQKAKSTSICVAINIKSIHKSRAWMATLSSHTQPITRLLISGKLGHFWASLVAQLVKNLPAIQETPVQFLGWEDPLEKG